MIWHGTRAWHADWSPWDRVLVFQRIAPGADRLDNVYVAMNMHSEPLEFELPAPAPGERWHLFANTSLAAPQDIAEPGDGASARGSAARIAWRPGDSCACVAVSVVLSLRERKSISRSEMSTLLSTLSCECASIGADDTADTDDGTLCPLMDYWSLK